MTIKEKSAVAIVGAGIIGASIAYNLSRKDERDVLLIDRGKAGGGSTSAALGGFRSQFSSELSIRLSQRSLAILEKFKDLTGYDPLIRHDGYVFAASSEHSYSSLERNVKLQRSLGVDVSLVSAEELQRRYSFYNFTGFLGGTFCQQDGHASTLAVLQGFLSKAREEGVELAEETEVLGITKKETGGYELLTSKGRTTAEKVMIAAGAYSGLVGKLASVEIPVLPYPRRVLVTKSFTDGIPVDIPLIIDVDSTFAFGREGLGLIFADNRPVPPGFELVFPEGYDEDIMRIAIERVPAASRSSISYANSGLYEMTPDSNPIVCEMPGNEGLYCCAGFAGHGFMHSPAIGELMAELVINGRTTTTSLDISAYDVRRFSQNKRSKEEQLII